GNRRRSRGVRKSMFNFFAKRLGYLLLTMVAVSFLVFILNEFSPGQVARKILGPYAEENSVALLTKQMGLDQPVLIRYVKWLWQILQGDLGKSTLWGAPVNDIIWDRLLHTLIIASLAFAIIVPASIILGVLAGMREGSLLDRSISVASIVTTSVPEFASG